MDLSTFPVFLCLCWLQAAVAHVEPPTNVTLHCHNLTNVLKWSYGQLKPGLRFKVGIGFMENSKGYPNEIWVDSSAPLQADVSFLSDPKNEYLLSVTAVVEQNESDSAPHDGISFSYFKDSNTDHNCFVDFPSLNVTAQKDGTVLLRFMHPWLVYHRESPSSPNTKPRKRKAERKSPNALISKELPVFNYDVVIINQKERHHNLDCMEQVCEETLTVDPAEKKHCLKVKGEVEKILVKATQEHCVLSFEESPNYLIYLYITASLLAVSVFVFVVYMVYRKLTSSSSPYPNATKITRKFNLWNPEAVREQVLVPEVGPASPTLLLPIEEEELTTDVPPSTEPDLRLPIGVTTQDEGVSDDVEEGNDEGPGYKQGGNLDEDDDLYSSETSGYEKRQVLVEIAPDELAEGYRG